MKVSTQLLTATALLMAVGTAHAAKTQNLEVKGQIGVSACQIVLAEGGKIKHDPIVRAALSKASNPLNPQSTNATITCDGTTVIKLKVVDNKSTSKTGSMDFKFNDSTLNKSYPVEEYFGLGKTSSNKSIGGFNLHVGKVKITDAFKTVEGVLAHARTGTIGESWYTNNTSQFLTNTTYPYFTPHAGMNSAVNVPGKAFVIPIDVATSLAAKENFPTTEDTEFSGIATLSVETL